jgi:hypothetical protein
MFCTVTLVALLGCRSASLDQREPPATLVTDSTEYHAVLANGLYRADIGYRYTNHSRSSVSAVHCHTPPPPALEKNVGQGWVLAYSPVILMCETIPHFRVSAGATYRSTLHLAVAPPSRRMAPVLLVDSLPGTYRLRWALRAGDDPTDRDAPMVEAISNEFDLLVR